MKSTIIKSILGLALLLTPAIETIASQNERNSNKRTTVYICTGPKSYRYHRTKNCRGFKNCSTEIQAVSLSYAKSIGRTPCGYCY